MIKIEKTDVIGWEHVIRGMRNPMNSWGKLDSIGCETKEHCSTCEQNHTSQCYNGFILGDNDHKLMMQLAKGGPVHGKFRRMLTVYLDITAPLYWWKEFDTYKVGTVANSCSTMHKIHAKEFTSDDFSHEHLFNLVNNDAGDALFLDETNMRIDGDDLLGLTINVLNYYRKRFLATKDKRYWW